MIKSVFELSRGYVYYAYVCMNFALVAGRVLNYFMWRELKITLQYLYVNLYGKMPEDCTAGT